MLDEASFILEVTTPGSWPGWDRQGALARVQTRGMTIFGLKSPEIANNIRTKVILVPSYET